VEAQIIQVQGQFRNMSSKPKSNSQRIINLKLDATALLESQQQWELSGMKVIIIRKMISVILTVKENTTVLRTVLQ
jgi:hypothetical protein